MDILGYLKNTHKNPKFGRVRQIPIREFPTKFPNWDLSHSPKFGILWVFFKYPKISKIGYLLFFPVRKYMYTINILPYIKLIIQFAALLRDVVHIDLHLLTVKQITCKSGFSSEAGNRRTLAATFDISTAYFC